MSFHQNKGSTVSDSICLQKAGAVRILYGFPSREVFVFGVLSEKLGDVLKRLRGRGSIREQDVTEAMREVRRALLAADVNYKVAKSFTTRVSERVLGEQIEKSLTPGQVIEAAVHKELVTLLGGKTAEPILPDRRPLVVMLVGLQGSGKTTAAAKLALWCRSRKWSPQLVAADVQRPAAVQQLRVLGRSLEVPVFSAEGSAVEVAAEGVADARQSARDVAIVDTSGRLHIDEDMMAELAEVRDAVSPHQTYLVVDAMTGQEAVSVAESFAERIGLTGVIATKLDGDARGGAVLSVREVAGVPVAFASVGEKPDEFERFHPERMADRILGYGDVATLVEKTKTAVSEEQAERTAEKLKKGRFDLNDFYEQLQTLRKMGSLSGLVKMIPGAGKMLGDAEVDEKDLSKVEAIILSMTPEERSKPETINGSRRLRIARGSGTDVQDVGALLKQFEAMKKLVRGLGRGKRRGLAGVPFIH
jgi:signal recognition particle subunit SRP54